MFTIPNIYTSKNLKYFIAIPVFLMIISIFLASHLTLDSSLSGGISMVIQTNSTPNAAQFSAALASSLKVPQPAVYQSPGAIQVTIPNNQSLVNAENYLLSFYNYKTNYTNFQLNASAVGQALHSSPGNQTLQQMASVANAGLNSSLAGMNKQLSLELASVAPFVGSVNYNSNDPDNMSNAAQNAYTNAQSVYKQKVLTTLHGLIPFTSYTYQEVTPTLSRFFLSQLETIIIAAFVLISIAVLVVFRSWVPSLAIIFGAGNDMLIALGAMVVLGIPLGLPSLGGLLMLIGYAIDTEMLTAVRILKRKEGTAEERAYGAMKTGLTMTFAAIASFAVLFVVSLVAYVPTYYEISGVVLFGLIADVITTWLGNAPMILLYKKSHDHHGR